MLIYCRECEHECSDKADVCPGCGNPLKASSKNQPPKSDPIPAVSATPSRRISRPYEFWSTVKSSSGWAIVVGWGGGTLLSGAIPPLGGALVVVGTLSLIGFLVGMIGKWLYSDRKTVGGRSAIRSFHTKIVGVTHHNDNGTSRQKYVQKLATGQPLKVMRDPYNQHDANAIAVFNGSKQLGFLSSDLAEQFASVLDDGGIMECAVSNVTGGDGRNTGCNISITVYQ